MICPYCHGACEITGLGDPGARVTTIPCLMCESSGVVDDAYPQWQPRGAACQERRIAAGWTLRAFCERTGLNIIDVVRMQMGFSDPAPLEAALESLGG